MSAPGNDRRGWHDVPLPGLHKCITWQLNVTLHPDLSSGKWVSILRDPDAQIELSRAGTPLVADTETIRSLSYHVEECLTILKHLGNIPAAPMD
jgi:hypothetical protein